MLHLQPWRHMSCCCCCFVLLVLHLQGLPFAIAGVGDLLALFRCVSCRYRFSTDVTRPALMGAIGRVYSSCEVRSCTRSWWQQQQQRRQ
jgi:hypothetical protein